LEGMWETKFSMDIGFGYDADSLANPGLLLRLLRSSAEVVVDTVGSWGFDIWHYH